MRFQDFVQLPWQKQTTQTSHGLSAASSSSGDVGLSSSYGPASGKSASDFLSSAGNARMDNVSRPLDISVEGFESPPVSLLRCFAVAYWYNFVHCSVVYRSLYFDVLILPLFEAHKLIQLLTQPVFSSLNPFRPLNWAWLNPLTPLWKWDYYCVFQILSHLGLFWFTKLCFLFILKETGASLQTLTSAATMERLGGNNIIQPSLSTRDALEKYHIVTQKVSKLSNMFCCSLLHRFWLLCMTCLWLIETVSDGGLSG